MNERDRHRERQAKLLRADMVDATFRMQNEAVLHFGLVNRYEYYTSIEKMMRSHLIPDKGGVFGVSVRTRNEEEDLLPIVEILEPYFREAVFRDASFVDRENGETYFGGLVRTFNIAPEAAVAAIAYGIRHEVTFKAYYAVQDASNTSMTDPLLIR
jgi:hypothetical protein